MIDTPPTRHRSEGWLRAFAEQSGELAVVLDAEGVVLHAGGACARIVALEASALEGRNLVELAADEADAEALGVFVRQSAGSPGTLIEGRSRLRSATGSVRQVTLRLRNLVEDPDVGGILLTAHDVTDSVENEQRFKVQLELLDRVGQFVFVVGPDNRVNYWNRTAEKVFGWSWPEVIEGPIGKMLIPSSAEGAVQKVRETVSRDGAWRGEATLRRKDGSSVTIFGSVGLVRSDGSRIVTGVDVTEQRNAVRQLHENRELVQTVIASAPIILSSIDAEGLITLAIGRGLTSIGLDPEETVGQYIWDLFPNRDDIAREARRALDGESFRAVRDVGGRVLETWWSPFFERSGAIAVSIDVTEQKRAEQQQERLLRLLDSTPDFVGIAGAGHEVLYINPAGRRMRGLAPDQELDGLSIADFHPRWALGVLEDVAIPTAVREGTWSGELALLGADGREIPVWQVIVAHPSELGDVIHLSTIASDITEVRQATERLHFQARLLDAVGQAVVATDLGGVVTYWNRAAEALYGWNSEEALGRDVREVVITGPDEDGGADALRALVEGESVSQELTLLSRDGVPFPVLFTGGAIRDEAGRRIGSLGVSTDLSETKALEADLRQAQRMEAVGRLAGGVAHDFNNLLTVVRMHVELLLLDADQGTQLEGDLQEILTASNRATELTRQLLAFGRKQVFEERMFDLGEDLVELQSMLRRVIPESIVLVVEMEQESAWVVADPAQVHQVVLNLVINAVDACEGRGTIEVMVDGVELSEADVDEIPWAVMVGRYVRLTIRDDGIGMSPEVVEHIFEPFFTTKPVGKGTGMGLASVYGIVKQSGGHIFVESEEGVGTTFRVLLPTAGPIADEGSGPAEAGVVPVTPKRSETVLVVEDDAAVRAVTVRVLQAAGHRVFTADNGHAALGVIEREGAEIDVVLSDVVMPEMGGVELARALARIRPDLPIILCSGYARDELVGGAEELGVAFLGKPFTSKELVAAIRGVLDE